MLKFYGSLAAFDIPVVAHVNTRRRIEEMRMWSWTDAALAQRVQQRRQTAFTAANIKKEWGDARQVVLPAPTITYTHQMTIDLGGTTCMLLHTTADHADDCTVIYLPEERTLFLGDALYADTMTWSYSSQGALALVETLERLEVDRCLLSHDDKPLERDAYQEWLRVMKHAGQLVQQVPRNAPSLEDAVARKLGRLSGIRQSQELA